LRRITEVAPFLVLLITALLFQSVLPVRSELDEERFTIRSSVTFFNNGTDVWNLTGEEYAVSLFMNTSWQSVSLSECSLPLVSVRTDADGNRLDFLNLTQLSHGQSVDYIV